MPQIAHFCARPPTYVLILALSYSLIAHTLTHAQFLGVLGTVGNGQSILVTKEDLDTVWTDMVRMHKKQVRV